MRECEKGCQKAWAAVNIKTSIFNLQFFCHFCMDFYVTNMNTFIIIIIFFFFGYGTRLLKICERLEENWQLSK